MGSVGKKFAFSGSAIACAMALCAPALAQENASENTPATAAEPEDDNVIVVTGSLIRRPNNTAVSPIVTLGTDAVDQAGTINLNDALNQLPGFTVGGNAATGGQGTGGRASINLRGLGTNRNLVLLDGRRLPVSDVRGSVDTNIIPESIIGGIDVITGGASAIYGSDAMSGVVNFRTNTTLEGFEVDSQYNISERGDAEKFNASLSFGSRFAEGRGRVLASFSYTTQDPLQGSEREFFFDKVPSSFIGTGTFIPSATNAPDGAVVSALFNANGVPGTINPLDRLGFNDNGSLFVQNGGQNFQGPNGTDGFLVINGNVRMPVGQQLQVLNSLDRKTAFVKADYDLFPDITAYGQFLYVDLTVNTESGGSLPQFPALTTIPVTNPFIPGDLATVLASRPDAAAPFAWNTRFVGVPEKNWDENYIVQQYLGGVRGSITDGWEFDAFVAYDESRHNQTMNYAVLKSQVQRLLNAPDGGASLCAGGFNPFGLQNALSISDECVSFITKDAVSVEETDQVQLQGQVNGELFDLGAGPVQLAVLGGYRRNTYEFTPDFDLTANSGFAPGGNIEAVVNTLPVPKTAISVTEIAAQIDIPLISGVPFIEEFAIGAAGRISDYSVSGSVESFEFDARWRPIDNLLLRGSFQRAVRAPNIGELFSPPQGQQLVIGTPPNGIGDPCDVRSTARNGPNAAQVEALCIAQGIPAAAIATYQFPTTATGQTTSGNLALTPERANTFNLGGVFNSDATSGIFGDFSFSVDYYNIKIKNVISPVPGLTVLSNCFNGGGANPNFSADNEFCQLIDRDATGELSTVRSPFLNLGALKTDGVELQFHFGLPASFFEESGRVYLDSNIGWVNNFSIRLLPGDPFLNFTGISNGGAGPNDVPPRATPEWKSLSTLGYRSDNFGLGLRWRFQSSLDDNSKVLTPNNIRVGVPSYHLFDLFANASVTESISLRAGINNLFDRGLPFVASSQISTDPAQFDLIGRAFFVGARINF